VVGGLLAERVPLASLFDRRTTGSDAEIASEQMRMVYDLAANLSATLNYERVLDAILDISRLEAGQMPLERQPVLLPKLAQSVIQQMMPLAERETVTLELQTAADISPVDVDQELISRVLVNLVDNALKYSPRNSTVTIQIVPEPVKRDETVLAGLTGSPSPTVHCTVLDTGPGIPSEYRKRIFERFAQLDDRRKGKGLGLAFCQLAVQAHGGRIWVEDNPSGQGSAFSFTLPTVSPELLAPTDTEATE